MPDNLEERALAEAAKRGDENAWRVLFERHADLRNTQGRSQGAIEATP
jgi:hypothetical protein